MISHLHASVPFSAVFYCFLIVFYMFEERGATGSYLLGVAATLAGTTMIYSLLYSTIY